MAERIFHGPRAYDPEVIIATAVLTVLGNGTPANGTFTVTKGTKAFGTNASPALFSRTGVGAYSVLIKDKFYELVGAQVSIAPHGGAARGVKLGAIDVNNATAASRTAAFVIVNTAEAAVETPAAETDTVYLTLFLKNSSAR